MPPQNTNVLARGMKQPGTYDFGPVSVDSDVKGYTLIIHRVSWDGLPEDREIANVRAEVSYDSGTTWEFLAGLGVTGGEPIDRSGNPAEFSTLTVTLRDVGSATRQVRGSYVAIDRHRVQIDVQTLV